MDDIPPRVRNRPTFAALAPEDEQEFLRKQAGFEAAYRTTGDPQVLVHALLHACSSAQTTPSWLVWDIVNDLIEHRTGETAERDRERMRHVQRYLVVRDLRSSGHTKDSALDQATVLLAEQRAAVERGTIEDSYDRVQRDLKRQGNASQFFYFVELRREAYAMGNAGAAGSARAVAQAVTAPLGQAPSASADPPDR
jgi:hypothetical protein